jgi:AraC-like DNA-binding protein
MARGGIFGVETDMIISAANPYQQRELSAWLDALQDNTMSLHIDNAVHDLQPPRWRHDGTRYPGHINWLVLSGGVRGQLDGRLLRVEAGSWLCLAPNTPLHFRPLQDDQRLGLLRFRLHLARDGQDLPIPSGGFLLPDALGLRSLASRLISDAASSDVFAMRRRRGLLTALYAEAFQRLCKPSSTHARCLDESEIASLEEYVARTLPDMLSPQQLARHLRMKPDTFARAFKRGFGQSPRLWLSSRRIRHAADLLLMQDATATTVSVACGYADVFHFCRQFREVMGHGTRDWRRRHGLH